MSQVEWNIRTEDGPGAPVAPGEAASELSSLQRELDSLEQEAQELRNQVKTLVRTEGRLYKIQEQLDLQVKIFRKLYELGQKINATFSVEKIIESVPPFVLYELGYQRTVVFLSGDDDPDLQPVALDGYYDEDLESEIRSYKVKPSDPFVRSVVEAGKLVHRSEGDTPPLDGLAAILSMDHFIAFPLFGQESLVGLLIAGNTADEEEFYVPVKAESEAAYGFANLAGQVAAALHGALLYRELAKERNLLEQKVQERTQELSEAYKTLEKAGELKSQFFANISHELRTPLTLSIGPLEGILHGGEGVDPEVARHHLEMIHHNQLRLLKLINDLLDFSKIDAGRMTASFRREDVIRSIKYYVATIEAAAQTRGMQARFVSQVESLELYIDHDKFEKVVMNLLSNAFKFTPDGGSITVRVEEHADFARVEVADSGVGIPEAALPKIFERFSQVDGSEKRRYAGTGIGLAMVKEYVHMHGGTVGVKSIPGQGTTFTLTFPKGSGHLDPDCVSEDVYEQYDGMDATLKAEFRAEEQAKEQPSISTGEGDSSPAPQPTVKAPGTQDEERGTVLVVDDVPDMRRFISHVLASSYNVVTAVDGQDGLEKALELNPDIVVSDVMMPRMTGFELLDALRSAPGFVARTPVILVSARADLSKRLEGLSHGADDYLVKPFNATELQSRVKNLIRLRRKERDLFVALERLEERDARITADLQQARDFQQSILPPLPKVAGVLAEVVYEPTDLVGGDYYDFAIVEATAGEPSRLRVFLADATGHGVKASLATMFMKIEYDRVKNQAGGPAKVLEALNNNVAGIYGHLSLRFTAACVDLCPATGRVWYSSAAHPALIRVGSQGVTEAEHGGTFVGLLADIEFPETEWQLEPGEAVFIYTDGITEQSNASGEEFDTERLLDSLQEAQKEGRPLCAHSLRAVLDYAGEGRHLDDDITSVSLQWMGPQPLNEGRLEST